METYLIEVNLPAAAVSYHLSVPCNMQVGTMTQLVASVFERLSNGAYTATNQSRLCRQATGESFDPNLKIRETSIRNGTKLFLY